MDDVKSHCGVTKKNLACDQPLYILEGYKHEILYYTIFIQLCVVKLCAYICDQSKYRAPYPLFLLGDGF